MEPIGGAQATIMTVTKRLSRIFIDEEQQECILRKIIRKKEQWDRSGKKIYFFGAFCSDVSKLHEPYG